MLWFSAIRASGCFAIAKTYVVYSFIRMVFVSPTNVCELLFRLLSDCKWSNKKWKTFSIIISKTLFFKAMSYFWKWSSRVQQKFCSIIKIDEKCSWKNCVPCIQTKFSVFSVCFQTTLFDVQRNMFVCYIHESVTIVLSETKQYAFFHL